MNGGYLTQFRYFIEKVLPLLHFSNSKTDFPQLRVPDRFFCDPGFPLFESRDSGFPLFEVRNPGVSLFDQLGIRERD